MAKNNSRMRSFGLVDLLKLLCYAFVCSVLGFVVVWCIFSFADGRPGSVCGELDRSFSTNDTFEYSQCSLSGDDGISLVLDVKKGMEVYFQEIPGVVTDDDLAPDQLDYYCAQFFDRVRINSLDLKIRVDKKIRQRISVNRNACVSS